MTTVQKINESRFKRAVAWTSVVLGLLLLLFVTGPRVPTEFEMRQVHFADASPARIQSFVATREAARDTLRPDLEARVLLWQDKDEKAPWAIVYLHGFSASPREVHPLIPKLAAQLEAHAFLPRLAGHGLEPDGLGEEASFQAWMDDAFEALAIGRVLGERVLLIGYSNGANLALLSALNAVESMRPDKLVLMAPNFQPADPSARFLAWPWARFWVPLWAGPERVREALHESHAAGWSLRYATRALFPMMSSVLAVQQAPLENLQLPVKLIYSETDKVVDVAAIRAGFDRIGSEQKSVLAFETVEDPSGHILAGDAFSPATTDAVVEAIIKWLN